MHSLSLLCSVSLVLAAGAFGQPVNDECAGALPIGEGTTTVDTGGATTSLEPTRCLPIYGDVWFTFTAPRTEYYLVSSCTAATNFDSMIEIYEGVCGSLTSLACREWDLGCQVGHSRPGFWNGVTPVFLATQGQPYTIRVGAKNPGDGGRVDLYIRDQGAHSETYGTGTIHPAQGPATLSERRRARLGDAVEFTCTYRNLTGDPGAFLVGVGRTSLPFLDGTILVDGFAFLFAIPGVRFSSYSGGFPIPNDARLLGQSLTLQAIILDSHPTAPSPYGFVFSDGIEFFVGY